MTFSPERGDRPSENTLLLEFGEVQPIRRDFELCARIPGTGSAGLMPRRPCRAAKRLFQNEGIGSIPPKTARDREDECNPC